MTTKGPSGSSPTDFELKRSVWAFVLIALVAFLFAFVPSLVRDPRYSGFEVRAGGRSWKTDSYRIDSTGMVDFMSGTDRIEIPFGWEIDTLWTDSIR